MSGSNTMVGLFLGLIVSGAIGMGLRPAFAQAPQTATCITFAASGTSGSGQKALDNDKRIVYASFQSIAPAVEVWRIEQLSASKVNFSSTTVSPNASVVCAW